MLVVEYDGRAGARLGLLLATTRLELCNAYIPGGGLIAAPSLGLQKGVVAEH